MHHMDSESSNPLESENPQPDAPTPEMAQQPGEHPPLPAGNEQAEASAEMPDGQVEELADEAITDTEVDPHVDMGLLEAYLFSTHSPLTAGRLAELFQLESTKPIRKALRVLNEQYAQSNRCFRVEQVAGGFQLLTLPDFGDKLKALHQKDQDSKLTKAALETLSIIAYKQPILRAEVEAIRGVASGETIRSLMEKHLVKIAGRAEEPGRPILYGTTKRFLEVFGLNSLKDLPQPEGTQKPAGARTISAPAQELADAAAEQSAASTETAVPEVEDVATPVENIPPEVAEVTETSAEQPADVASTPEEPAPTPDE